MARIFIEGFENQDAYMGIWDYSNHTAMSGESDPPAFIDAGVSPTGSNAWSCGDDGRLRKYITAAQEYYFAFDYALETIPGSGECAVLLAVYEDDTARLTPVFTVIVDADGYVSAVRTKATEAVLDTSADPIFDTVDVAKRVEIRIKTDSDPDGRFEVKIDGVSKVLESGGTDLDESTFEAFEIGVVSGLTTVDGDTVVGDGVYDNLVVDNAAYPGTTMIQVIYPSGAGNATNWTPSTGSNWDCVDEASPSATDYVSINAVDTLDTYAMDNLGTSPTTVKCVQVDTLVRCLGDPTPGNLSHALRISTTDYFGSDITLPGGSASDAGGITGLSTLWETSPATSSAFSESEINGMEVGIKSKT